MIPNVIYHRQEPGRPVLPPCGLTKYTDGDLARTGQKSANALGRHLTGSCDNLPESFFTLRLLAYLIFPFIKRPFLLYRRQGHKALCYTLERLNDLWSMQAT
jgi:hypothetical protein